MVDVGEPPYFPFPLETKRIRRDPTHAKQEVTRISARREVDGMVCGYTRKAMKNINVGGAIGDVMMKSGVNSRGRRKSNC